VNDNKYRERIWFSPACLATEACLDEPGNDGAQLPLED